MQSLTDLLSKKYRYHLKYSRALEIVSNHWDELVKGLSKHIQVDSIYKNQLIVHCNNPVWLSEIDYFSKDLTVKINELLKSKKVKLEILSVKPVLKLSKPSTIQSDDSMPPEAFMDRIKWNVELKKRNGAILCSKCEKIYDKNSICRLCQLTS